MPDKPADLALGSIREAYDDLFDHMRNGNDGSVEYASERLIDAVTAAKDVCTVEPELSEYLELRSMLGSVGISGNRIQ